MPPQNRKLRCLVLGIGNLLMSDEGVGVHAVQQLQQRQLPEGVECFDGGTGSFLLLEPMQSAERIILIDAALDDTPVGTIRRIEPKFSTDYPRTLTAHDIGLKDLLDAFYLLGDQPAVTLFAVTIAPDQEMSTELSEEVQNKLPLLSQLVLSELEAVLRL